MTPESWQELLEMMKLDEVTIRDLRYDAVFHLRTAAIGAESFYNYGFDERTQTHRSETLEQVRSVRPATHGKETMTKRQRQIHGKCKTRKTKTRHRQDRKDKT
jgi:hypothetical protein